MSRVRRLQIPEFQEAAALDRLAWQDTPGGGPIPDGEHVWRHWVEDALVFGAFQVESGAGPRLGGVSLAFPGISGVFWLHKIFVHPDLRGGGVGRELLGALLGELDRRRAVVRLTVNPANAPARSLYARHGFLEMQFVADYYGPGQDRLELERPVGGQPR